MCTRLRLPARSLPATSTELQAPGIVLNGADYSPVLVGRDVLIVADRDDEGRAHATYVAACLDKITRSCWIVEAAAGKDSADHIGTGYAVTDFVWWDR